jgi:hypothetical protein
MPRCPFCDRRNSASATACSECGAELSAPDGRSSSPVTNPPVSQETDIDEAVPESELDPFEAELVGFLKEGQKIEAIKRYRKKTGADLKTAKVAVEQFAERQGLSGSQSGCGTASAVLLAVVVASWMLL